MLLVVAELEAIDTAALDSLGYEERGEYGIPGRRYFVKGNPRSHHLHAFASGAPEIDRHLAFRDLLRADPAARSAYMAAKRKALAEAAGDKAAYQSGKSETILRLMENAARD